MSYSEANTRINLIDPNLYKNRWKDEYITREYFFTEGRKLIGNKRGKRYFVDYLLTYKNINLAIIEAKSEDKDPLDGLQQSINYAKKLEIDYVYSTNGHVIYEHSMIIGSGKYIKEYPTPDELFKRKFGEKDTKKENIITHPFYIEGTMKPRFYQQIAVDKSIKSILNGDDRVLLTLATGTGKTYIAFQIVYKLLKSKWNRNKVDTSPKILFLADRNVLKDQSMNTFNPLEKDCVEIKGKMIKKRGGKVPTAGNIFFAIYQSIADNKNKIDISEEDDNYVSKYYKQYLPNFFDLIIIDECHRGSANDKGSWREILNYFKSAVHLGLTATPERKVNVDTYEYFGKPIYEYSLKDGINDGFLTPFKVKKIKTNIDEYEPNPNDIVYGEFNDEIIKKNQFEKKFIIPKRTKLFAKTILDNINPMDKTIIFCVNQKHAIDMKVAIDEFKSIKDNDYCVRVTSNEGNIGKNFLEMFQNNDRKIPTILTSSKMLTTGVDTKNVRNIVLTAQINSITEFKQIIGRGTRVYEGKDFFTIIDFMGATNKFYDKRWDGEAEEVTNIDDENYTTNNNSSSVNDNKSKYGKNSKNKTKPKEKVIIDIRGRELKVIDIETSYVGMNAIPLKTDEYLNLLIGVLGEFYNDEKALREIWSNPTNRRELLNSLKDMNIDELQLNDLKVIFKAQDSDIYDLLAHLSFNLDIKTRNERVLLVENSNFIEKYHNLKAKEFIEFILNRYKKDGVKELEEKNLSTLIKLNGVDTSELKNSFNGYNVRDEYFKLQREIYR